MARQLLLLSVILLVPLVPFLVFHESMESMINEIGGRTLSPWSAAGLVFGLLSSDILLPIPSSLVSTLAGGRLPIWLATIASWMGMTVGAIAGFALSRVWGRPLAERLASSEDIARMELVGEQHATWLLAVTRALPILAEATVVWLGVHRISWTQFLPPVVLSNLGIALAYSILGRYAADHEWLAIAASISAALPLLIAVLLRSRMK